MAMFATIGLTPPGRGWSPSPGSPKEPGGCWGCPGAEEVGGGAPGGLSENADLC